MRCEDGDPPPWDNSTIVNRTCAYETPSGYRVSGKAMNWNFMRQYQQYHTLWNSTTYWDTLNRKNSTHPDPGIATIAALKWLEYDDQAIAKPEIWLESAHECKLTWCAKEYGNTYAANGTLTDEPTRISGLQLMDSAPCKINDTSNSTFSYFDFSATGNNITKYVIAGYKDGEVPFLPCNRTNGDLYDKLLDDPKAFWVNQQDDINLGSAIGAIFTTTFETLSRPGDDPARALYRSNNLTQLMEDLARSMTNQIRIGPNQTDAHGIVQRPEQHIHVRWEWMILPVALVVSSIAFLIVSMTYESSGNRAVWKSSALPSLYHGLSGSEASQVASGNLEDMERRAKGMQAILRENADGSLKLMPSGDPK